ncbi:MAG: transketolase, partial [Alphaproteobacteria bacterium]|nr:transketolase [Alphaproteobacteria bacterium]
AREAWQGRLAKAPQKAELERRLAGDLPAGLGDAVAAYKAELTAKPQTVATRKASEMALEVVTKVAHEMIGGSADLTGSNNTRTKPMVDIQAGTYGGTYVRWGVREHAMAAAMNGMALHGGVIPFGGTFLVFTDYCRPAIRLAALMEQRVIFVMTHDSIGLGEDGPTHQPVEHLAALRAIPNLNVFRPADVVETVECWLLALEARHTPSVIALTRQNLPQVRRGDEPGNPSSRGAYVLREADGAYRATILATGSEVEIALAAREALQKDGIPTRVVSMPSWELFRRQDAAYRASILDCTKALVAVEAASGFGWAEMTGGHGRFVGMAGFGASAPAGKLYRHFGITAEAVAAAVKADLKD